MEVILIGAALLVLLGILASKISDRFGIPALLLFLILGMLAGSDGPGGIYFDDPALAQSLGVLALIVILFSGGLDTEWDSIRPVLKEGLILSTVGVLLTAVTVGLFAKLILDLTLVEGLLIGAIVSSTDAAAVFSVLRSKGISLTGNLKPLLELESGSNDPMAIFLTVGLVQLLVQPDLPLLILVGSFFVQMILGAAVGIVLSWVMLFLINRLRLGYEGLYPVLLFALVILTYGIAAMLGGNGFLAVYLAGIVLGRNNFIHKRSMMRFSDGIAWLMQITMFITLGLLVFPSRLISVIGVSLLLALFLMLVARPASVLLSLMSSRIRLPQKLFISWVGLRGAVPIILATYPLLAEIPHADLIFNVVFFVVLTSVLLQGTTLPYVARLVQVDAPPAQKRIYPIEFNKVEGFKSDLKEVHIPPESPLVGKAIFELGDIPGFLIILIARGSDLITPSGGVILQADDTLLSLSDQESLDQIREQFNLTAK